MICLYYPDYMDGVNATGWHFHFLSADRTWGGHVFKADLEQGTARLDKISKIELQLPTDAAFDTYSLMEVNEDDIKEVEQGSK